MRIGRSFLLNARDAVFVVESQTSTISPSEQLGSVLLWTRKRQNASVFIVVEERYYQKVWMT
jgi:hypothetical protein